MKILKIICLMIVLSVLGAAQCSWTKKGTQLNCPITVKTKTGTASRIFGLHLPPNFDPKLGMVMFLHPAGGYNYTWIIYGNSGWTQTSDKYGFALIMPTRDSCETGWNSTCTDDDAYITQLAKLAQSNLGTDPNRTFVGGFSGGAIYTYALMQRFPGLFAAGAVGDGGMFTVNGQPNLPPLNAPSNVIVFHGNMEALEYYCGKINTLTNGAVWSADQVAQFWATQMHCKTVDPGNLCLRIGPNPANANPNMNEFRATNCDQGKEFKFYKLVGGLHRWYGLTDLTTPPGSGTQPYSPYAGKTKEIDITEDDATWQFFNTHPLVGAPPPPPPPPPPPVSGGDNMYCGMDGHASNDGPAQLPQKFICTRPSDMPSPGATINVPLGGSVQTAFNGAKCGDTLVLQAGGSYVPPTSLAKACDAGHWVTLRTSTPDAQLPALDVRITPAWAGVVSLPGRPTYAQPVGGAANLMATLTFPANSPGITYAGGAYLHLLGIEMAGGKIFTFNKLVGGDHVVFDKVLVHGTPGLEAANAFQIQGSTNFALVDSWLFDLSCIAVTGTCIESHGVVAASGAGPYKVVDNFIEAAAQSVLFGGGDNQYGTPADIEVRLNHFFKPMSWMPGDPTFDGITRIVKNHLECKNCQRLLAEGNISSNVWGGFSQVGASVLMTPKNQSPNICPTCFVRNVTIRYSTIHNSTQPFQISNGPSDTGGWAIGGDGYSIHDVIADGISFPNCYKCAVFATHFGSAPGVPATDMFHDFIMDHVTMVGHVSGFMALGGPMPAQMSNFTITNSIFDAGTYGVFSTGGTTNCASGSSVQKTKLDACFLNYAFTSDVIVGGSLLTGWPVGNLTSAATDAQVGYVDLPGGDYHLAPGTPFKGACGGKDCGADVDAVNTAIKGVN